MRHLAPALPLKNQVADVALGVTDDRGCDYASYDPERQLLFQCLICGDGRGIVVFDTSRRIASSTPDSEGGFGGMASW